MPVWDHLDRLLVVPPAPGLHLPLCTGILRQYRRAHVRCDADGVAIECLSPDKTLLTGLWSVCPAARFPVTGCVAILELIAASNLLVTQTSSPGRACR